MELFVILVLGLFFVAGAVIVKISKNKEIIEHWSISIATGAMIGLVLFDLVPEIIEERSELNLFISLALIILGILLLKALDVFIPEHNHSDQEESDENFVHIGLMSAIAIILHNIIEGMGTYTLLLNDFGTGISMTIGVGLHNIPMGMLIFSTLQKEKKTKRNIILFLATVSTFIGGILFALLKNIFSEQLIIGLIAITLGMVLYILIFELIPSLIHYKKYSVKMVGCLIGLIIVAISVYV